MLENKEDNWDLLIDWWTTTSKLVLGLHLQVALVFLPLPLGKTCSANWLLKHVSPDVSEGSVAPALSPTPSSRGIISQEAGSGTASRRTRQRRRNPPRSSTQQRPQPTSSHLEKEATNCFWLLYNQRKSAWGRAKDAEVIGQGSQRAKALETLPKAEY